MPPQRVTVIDDSPEVLELFEEALGLRGLEVEILDGCASPTQIQASAPDLLVVDLRLGTDSLPGWEIVRLARSHPPLATVPIIVCSAALDQLRGHEDEFSRIPRLYPLPKPFSLADLDSCLDEALGEPSKAVGRFS